MVKLKFKEKRNSPWFIGHWVAKIGEGKVIVDFTSHDNKEWYFYTAGLPTSYNSLHHDLRYPTKEAAMAAAEKWVKDNG